MSQDGERIAALEASIELLLKKTGVIEADVASIKTTLSSQRGFVAGMLTILAPLWGFVLFAASKAWDYFYGTPN